MNNLIYEYPTNTIVLIIVSSDSKKNNGSNFIFIKIPAGFGNRSICTRFALDAVQLQAPRGLNYILDLKD